jgi:hypothetical protein
LLFTPSKLDSRDFQRGRLDEVLRLFIMREQRFQFLP